MKPILRYLPILALLTCTANAQSDDYKNHPGYVDFGNTAEFETGASFTEVFIQDPLLKFVAAVSKEVEPQFADMLANLALIRVLVFEADNGLTESLSAHMETLIERMHAEQWQQVVRVKKPDESVGVYLKLEDEEKIVGLCVIVNVEGNERVFVNIVGYIDLELIARLGQKFAIPVLEELKDEIEDAKK